MLGVFAGQVNLNSRFDVRARDGTNEWILKETDNLKAHNALHFVHYNFVRAHLGPGRRSGASNRTPNPELSHRYRLSSTWPSRQLDYQPQSA
jgi:hypothetical protein